MAEGKREIQKRDVIASIERGLNILCCFDQQSVSMTPAEVARRTDLPRATARRVLLTLEQLGYAASDGKSFQLTPKVLDLAHGYLAKSNISELIDPILTGAMERTKESCALLIRDERDMVAIASSNPATIGYVPFPTGTRFPLHVGSGGRVLLAAMSDEEINAYLAQAKFERTSPRAIAKKSDMAAEIKRVRKKGYSLTVDEFSIGIFGMAVPVANQKGDVIASVSCLGNSARIRTDKEQKNVFAALKDASHKIRDILPERYEFSAAYSMG